MPREGREHAAEPGKAKSLGAHRAPAIAREREAMVFQGTKAAPSVLNRVGCRTQPPTANAGPAEQGGACTRGLHDPES